MSHKRKREPGGRALPRKGPQISGEAGSSRYKRRRRGAGVNGLRAELVGIDEAIDPPAILPGLPGGEPYRTRRERTDEEAELRIDTFATLASFNLGGQQQHDHALRYGLPRPELDVAGERRRLLAGRARAMGLALPENTYPTRGGPR